MSSLSIGSYQFGDMLGRGASGSVFRALNFLTGETVAIKSISLLTLSPSALPDIMSEIDLLKNLNHPNIVKYKGFARDKESLHIILEYCENGSLQTILKKFGKFPESLVAVYIAQVLEGLIYLHEQGVIHRDIKGANILTNKDGSVKLADFGVSSRTAGPALDKDGEDLEVVGSPYWMAPEVIEQNGSSTASDIWSVGCVVVELLEGQPPHGELAPMQAMWRIVQDEGMRIPEGASPIVKDFLYHCFQKDPNLRVSAKKLAKHPWMLSVRKSESPNVSPTDPTTRAPSKAPAAPASSTTASDTKKGESKSRTSSDEKTAKPATVYDEAVMRVRQWNEALNASPTRKGSVRRLPSNAESPRKTSNANAGHSKKLSDGHPLATLFKQPSLPTRTSADSLVAEPSTSAEPSPHRPPQVIQGALHVNDMLSKAKEAEGLGESWDDDFASDASFANLTKRKANDDEDGPDQSTIRPFRSPTPGGQSSTRLKPTTTGSRAVSSSAVDDYSDLALDEDAGDLAAKMANLKMRNKTHKGILHPNDLRKLRQAPPPPSSRIASTPVQAVAPTSAPATPLLPSPSALGVTSPRPMLRSPPNSRQNSYRYRTESAESHPELDKYTENDEDDYSDIFDKHTSSSSTLSKSLQLTKRSNKSWLGDEDGDEPDPFAEIDDDFDTEDLETNVLRDKKATLCADISKMIDDLVPKSSTAVLKEACDGLISLLDNAHEDLGLEDHFISSHGMLAVLEILEEKLSRDVAVRLLKIVNIIVTSNVDALETFCLVGGIPVIIPYTSKRHSLATRLEAATFIQQLTRSALPLQMFISCRGLKVLVELLDEDYSVNKTLILSSLEGIASVFELQSPTPRNDFCRMFVREGILDPLSTSILSTMRDESMDAEDDSCARAIGILLLFSQVAQADSRVRDAFANRSVMIRLLEACSSLPRNLLVTAIKAIKHLATSPQLIETLQNSMAMSVLVTLLGRSINKAHGNEIGSHIFQTIYSMTRLSKIRQEEAASAGIIPLLKTVIEGKSPLKPFALPVLCDMANAGKVSRRQLWRVDGLKLYLGLLSDPYWRVSALDAILAWMQDETARVEDVLLENEASQSIMMCFVESSGVSFEGILDPLLKILRLSTSVTSSVSQPPLFRHLAASLARPVKAVTKLNLLRLTRVFFEAHSDVVALSRYGVREIVERLSRQDDAVLVRELAKEILPVLGHRPAPVARTVPREPMRSSTSKAAPIPSSFSSSTSTRASMAPPPIPDRSSSYRHPSPSRRTTPSPITGGHYRQISPSSAHGTNTSAVTSDPGALRSPEASGPRKHKRQISRALVHDVSWQNDENGQLRMVRKSSK